MLFFSSFYYVVNMYFEYISLFVLNLINLFMPIYCCFYVPWFCLTNWKQIKEVKTCCLSNVKQTMFQHFYNSCYSLHSRFAVLPLGDDFTKKKVIFISLYLLICNILCFSVSYLIRCVVVTARENDFIQSFRIMTKDKSSHKVVICLFVHMRHVVTCTLHQE